MHRMNLFCVFVRTVDVQVGIQIQVERKIFEEKNIYFFYICLHVRRYDLEKEW